MPTGTNLKSAYSCSLLQVQRLCDGFPPKMRCPDFKHPLLTQTLRQQYGSCSFVCLCGLQAERQRRCGYQWLERSVVSGVCMCVCLGGKSQRKYSILLTRGERKREQCVCVCFLPSPPSNAGRSCTKSHTHTCSMSLKRKLH